MYNNVRRFVCTDEKGSIVKTEIGAVVIKIN